ncbi:MAG: hypothetical protein ABI045_00915 [Flavobacteriales bacterium]
MDHKLLNIFLRYLKIETQSHPSPGNTSNGEKQFILAKFLAKELRSIGSQDVQIYAHTYVTGHLPVNMDKKSLPLDSSPISILHPDFIGKGIRPQVLENYDGKDLLINAEKNIFLSPQDFPEIKTYTLAKS